MLTRLPLLLAAGSVFPISLHANAELAIPDAPAEFLINHCLNCHDEVEMKGDLNLDFESISWGDASEREVWERVHSMVDQGLMPPAKKPQPTDEELQAILPWLDESLLTHTPIGGTPPRRLNQSEYAATIRNLFDLPDFKLPLGFPRDTEFHGFNNLGEGLVLSPPLMEAYRQVAGKIADEIFPPEKAAPPLSSRSAGPEDMVLSFSAATVRGDALRLVSQSVTIMRSCSWASRIEIMASGTYRITVDASQFLPSIDNPASGFRPFGDEPMRLEVRARELSASDRSDVNTFHLLKEIAVSSESPETVTFEADLYKGQTVLFRWANAAMDHEFNALADQMGAWFEREPRFLAAWQKAVYADGDISKSRSVSLRGKNGWEIVTRHLADPELDMSQATMDTPMTKALLTHIRGDQGTFNIADALCHYFFDAGPALELHKLTVEGPLKLVDDPQEIRRKEIRGQLVGTRQPGQSDEAHARQILTRLLPQAFRRPVDGQTIDAYLAIAQEHWADGFSFESGVHLLIRNILISPRFLYRGVGENNWDDFDLATRLAYFLTQAPPDERLMALAGKGQLSAPTVLRQEAKRLLPDQPDSAMIRSFTGQWLDTNLLSEIMPDAVFKFSDAEITLAKKEAEWFFTEILNHNLPMTDFIDPGFALTSRAFAKDNYQYDEASPESEPVYYDEELKIERLPLTRGGRFGGLLGQSAVMMATANGVDTQPVLRGVWVLENILGMPPPEPPKNVPALTPDTRGTTTPRELLTAHTSEEACASCHQLIDPIGFVLENFDPVGNWRENWPKGDIPIDSSGVLPDGTEIADITELKSWIVAHIDLFSECISEKILTYATGRVPNYSERKEIEKIVQHNQANGQGFQDLVLDLVTSETFRTK
ncbi:MAG: DUF1588 domain-containing protein [Opitutaceae bacterium]|nr:DUF1588 domain-containing protein [Opitutaceae bacterium]